MYVDFLHLNKIKDYYAMKLIHTQIMQHQNKSQTQENGAGLVLF